MKSIVGSYLGVIFRPSPTLASLGEETRLREGLAVVVVATVLYSLFSLWLYLDGQQPSFTGNPIPAADYYLWQAIFLVAWLPAAYAIFVTVAHRLMYRALSTIEWESTAAALGYAFAIPITWAYLVPEMIVFGLFGHDSLAIAMRITGPVTLLWWAYLTFRTLRVIHKCPRRIAGFVTPFALATTIAFLALLIR